MISALLCSFKMKFGMSLGYVLGRFVCIFVFHKNRTGDDVIVTVLIISNSIKPTNFILDTNIQKYKVQTNDLSESDHDRC